MEDGASRLGVIPFIALSHSMVRVREALDKASRAEVRVVLYGEEGVGKRHAARYLHAGSPRSAEPFVRLPVRDPHVLDRVNESAFVPALGGGTLLLEGVDEAPAEVQAFLAAAVEEWAAAEEEGRAGVRIVATASHDLLQLMDAGRFRSDLYYLLEVFPLSLPPLRERFEEMLLFLEHFHRKFAPNRPVPPIPDEFVREALCYSWPGNLRELENLVAASATATGGAVWDLPAVLPRRGADPQPPPFHQSKREFEAAYVRRLLLLTSGNVTRAADLAGKARKDFYALLARNGVEPTDFRR